MTDGRTARMDDLPIREDLRGQSPYGAPQIDVPVRLNTNENSYPVPPAVVASIVAAVQAEAGRLNRYPDREFAALRADLAAYLEKSCAATGSGVSLDPAQIWAANGSNEVLQHIVQAFGGPGRAALGFTPAYSMHPIICRGIATRWVDGVRGAGPRAPFDLTADGVAEQIRRLDPDLVFLVSPNNPTGTSLSLDVVEAALRAGRGVVVVDEAYAEFARPGTRSAISLLAEHRRLVVCRTMSKAFALAGARLGYLAAAPEVCDALRLVRLPYHLSALTQAAARAALAHADELLSTVEAIKAQRDRIMVELPPMGVQPVPSDANFVLFGGLPDHEQTWRALLDRGVLIRDVGIAHHLRVTAGTEPETTAFLRALDQTLGQILAGQRLPNTLGENR
jgi:histidinol-phosphate aminotransferase